MQVLLVVSLLFLNRAAVRIEEAIILEVLLRQTGRVLVGQEREDLDGELLAIEVLISSGMYSAALALTHKPRLRVRARINAIAVLFIGIWFLSVI